MDKKDLNKVVSELGIPLDKAKSYLKQQGIKLKGGYFADLSEDAHKLLVSFANEQRKPEDVLLLSEIKIPSKEVDIKPSFTNLPQKHTAYLNSKIQEIQEKNGVSRLLFVGVYDNYSKNSFGFFKNIIHLDNKQELVYPNGTPINKIFVLSDEFEHNQKYVFEVELSTKKKEIEKQNNPYLLNAKIEKIEIIKELSGLYNILEEKKQEKQNLDKEITTLKQDFLEIEPKYKEKLTNLENSYLSKEDALKSAFLEKKRENEIKLIELLSIYEGKEKEIEREFTKKTNELCETIATLKEGVKQESLKIEADFIEFEDIYVQAQNQLHSQFDELLNKKNQMENHLQFLKEKIDVCKKLGFLSSSDANKYLGILSAQPFEVENKYLDFEKDLSANFPKLVTHIQNYLYHKKNLIYTEFQIKNFLSLLMTNDLIILSGLSGSGKTQIVKSFAEVLGGVAKIIPVKPNWTSSDDLLGYYNPIQSSFLPTPFTEAIAEAIQNPHQIYLICLDEMNLARAEYYFADFLSKMEERSGQPMIDLYAKHEEELFISEFQTLLTLIESAIGEKIVSSWQEFLETDSIRNRFFELLGNTEKETLLQIHSKMKRRLLDILKFPATIKIPSNVRFIGAINVDETTHYFSPKILDRVHIVKFENPLLLEDMVQKEVNKDYDIELKPVYVSPNMLPIRKNYPSLTDEEDFVRILKTINAEYLLPLNIDFGLRSMRQSINFFQIFSEFVHPDGKYTEAINVIILQKILPRFVFDGNEKNYQGHTKLDILKKLQKSIKEQWDEYAYGFDSDGAPWDVMLPSIRCSLILQSIIQNSENNGNQVNFYA